MFNWKKLQDSEDLETSYNKNGKNNNYFLFIFI